MFARSERAVIIKCHSTQQRSDRAVLASWTHHTQVQALLLGTESFDPGRYRLTRLNTQDCETIEIASLIVVPRAQAQHCASSPCTVDCSFQGLLAHSSLGYKIEVRQDPIQHVSSQRFRADIGLIVVSFQFSGS